MPDALPNVLLIAYHFPPLGLGGVGRALALYKYLGRYGINVFVLTVKNIIYPEYDRSLLEGVETSRIIRSGSLDPSRLLYLAGFRGVPAKGDAGGFSAGILCRPDYKRGWNYYAFRKACGIIEKNNIACVITTSPPPSTHMIGIKLKDKYRLPWIADFRDLWYSLPIEKIYKYRSQLEFARRLKQSVIERADEVVGVNKSILSYLGRGESIYNAADDTVADFWASPPPKKDDNIEIGVLGTISRLTPIEPLFEIINGVLVKDPLLKDKIRFIHCGKCNINEVMAAAGKSGLSDHLTLQGYLPKRQAIHALANCRVLYISVEGGEGYHILPGRIFDMLVSGKPILTVAHPDSDLAEIANTREYNIVVSHDRLDDAAGPLYSLITSPPVSHDEEDVKRYTASAMAEKYAAIIGRLINKN